MEEGDKREGFGYCGRGHTFLLVAEDVLLAIEDVHRGEDRL